MTDRIHQNGDPDWAIRAQAFAALKRLAISTGGPIPWAEISKGFLHQGERIHFAGRALGDFQAKANDCGPQRQDSDATRRPAHLVPRPARRT